ncbi:MAG: T9SS type A sorting domain-containing protein [Candidatus Hatepunaea meridiana]|nr:T9SS type A sorting domain-containing protein [Candidatus Hatepunaea meridiana]
MKPTVRFILVFLIILTTSSVIDARIINVPEDRRTIQDGIDNAENGDTVLVQPGTYVENINFEGRAITVASLILTTNDKAYIDSTIIDGDESGSVVRFDNEEDKNSILTGFTLTNGSGSRDVSGDICGGGVICIESSPVLRYLKVVDNVALYGAGLFIQMSSPDISHLSVYDNHASESGGGIYFSRAQTRPVVTYSLFYNNESDHYTGGVGCFNGAQPFLRNVTIADNVASPCGSAIVMYNNNHIVLENSIIYLNEGESPIFSGRGSPRDTITVSYCDIEDGQDALEFEEADHVIWGDNNIDDDPIFVDPDNGDFNLAADSPCIDAGDPESPEDPDGTRADMGARPFLQGGTLQGYVYDAADDSPIENALVTSTFGVNATTDEEGFWRFIRASVGDFDLTITKEGYNDSTLFNPEFDDEDTLEIIISLLHPEFSVSPDEISEYLLPDSSTETTITISNRGNGPLTWTITSGSRDPWTLRESIPVGQVVNDSRIEGVIFAGDHYYVAGANRRGREDGPNMIWVLNREGELVDSIEQCGNSNYGFRDLAWDGELIWASGERTIYAFTTDGEVVDTIEGSFSSQQALAWDSDRNILWTSGVTSQYIAGFDREGNEIDRIPRSGLRIYGFAYWGDDPDGYPLYILSSPGDGRQIVHKIRLDGDNSDTLFVAELTPEDGGAPNGAFITNRYDISSWVMMTIANDGSNDRIDVWQLTSGVFWLQIDADEGTTDAGDDRDIIVNVNAVDLETGDYEDEILIQHNAAGSSFTIDVTLRVRPYKVDDEWLLAPTEFGISNTYPNPFNSTAKLTYTVPQAANVTLRLFDIMGREVITLVDERHKAGRYTTVVSGEQLTTGVYIARLEAMGVVSLKKLVVVK